jgi:hypothetical protein
MTTLPVRLLDRTANHSPPLQMSGFTAWNGGRISFLSLLLVLFGRRQRARYMPRATRTLENNEARLYSAGLNQGFIDRTMAWR